MDIFTQRKLLVRIVILITALNLVLIGLFLSKDIFRKPPPGNNETENRDVTGILKRELNLRKEQVDKIRDLRQSYSEKEKVLSEAIKSERDSINMFMFNKNTNDELVRSLARRVAENDYQMELLRYQQAQDFKAICTPEQLEKFEGLVREIRDFFQGDKKPRRNNDNRKPRQ
jgi:Spy/CpxP family protein refolding chaperone